MSAPHSALDRAKEFLGEIEQRPLDYAEGLVYDLVEQLEAQQRLLFAADETFRWVAREYPKVIREMPPGLYRELCEARVPFPASDPLGLARRPKGVVPDAASNQDTEP